MIRNLSKQISTFSLMVLCLSPIGCNKDLDTFEKKENSDSAFHIIYEKANEYAAFCDLVKFQGVYYAAFRVGSNHAPISVGDANGYIMVLRSYDCLTWEEELVLQQEEWDMRDPCFCVSLNGQSLNLFYGKHNLNNPNPDYKVAVYCLNKKGDKLEPLNHSDIIIEGHSNYWLWKVYAYDGYYYGIAYYVDEFPLFVKSSDGINYSVISEIPQLGTEASIEFVNNELCVFLRSLTGGGNAYICTSMYPYKDWDVKMLNYMVESPESFQINGDIFVTGRTKWGMSTFYYSCTKKEIYPRYNYFAYGGYGDVGYSGIIKDEGNIYVVYYAKSLAQTHTCILETVLCYEQLY